MKNQTMYGFLAALLVIAVIISGCTEQKSPVATGNKTNASSGVISVKMGDIVEANYSEDGKNYSAVKFKEGSKTYKFEDNITGMKTGEIKNIILVEGTNVEINSEVEANTFYKNAKGEIIKIFNVTDESVYFGPKLAGETLYFNITVKNITFPVSKKDCLAKYKIPLEEVMFYHSNGCSYCQKMIPWVKDMQGKGYRFFFVESSNNSAMDILKDCMSDVLKIGGGVPQFGCPANLQMQLGAFPNNDSMKKFSDDCKAKALEININKTNATNSAVSGSTVTVSYVGKLKSGEIFDNGTISFKVGGGQMIKGFDAAVIGMKINEKKYAEISPENAYGYPSTAPKTQKIPADKFKSTYGEDAVLNKLYSASGLPWKVKVIKTETITRNITIKILNITSGMEAFLKGTGLISQCANNVSLDKKKFYECYSSGVKKAVIDADIKFASGLGVSGTPTFFTGCNASIIEKICSSLSSSATQTCKGRLKTNTKLQCEEGGKLVVYEFTDLQCPYCNNAEPLIKELLNSTDVKLNVKLFPLSFHANSDKESFATECARDQGKFEEFKSCAFRKFFSEGVRQIEE